MQKYWVNYQYEHSISREQCHELSKRLAGNQSAVGTSETETHISFVVACRSNDINKVLGYSGLTLEEKLFDSAPELFNRLPKSIEIVRLESE